MNKILTLSDDEWIIRDKIYNLSSWIKLHPGGPTILSMNRGRDCTELFETYHALSPKSRFIEATLGKYFVRNVSKDELALCSPFNWNSSKYKLMKSDLSNRVLSYFKQTEQSSKMNTFYHFFYGFLFFVSIIASYFYVNGYWASLPILSLLYWYFSGDLLHSGLHYSVFEKYWMNEAVAYLFGWFHCNFAVWMFQHTISHHSYTNIPEYDVDLEWHKSVWYEKPNDTNRFRLWGIKKLHSKHIWFQIKIALVAPLTSLLPILCIVDSRRLCNFRYLYKILTRSIYFQWRYFKFALFVSYAQTMMVIVIIPLVLIFYFEFGVIKALSFMLIPRLLHGLIFHFFSQISHINEFAFQNCALKKTDNFIIHQVMSCQDYCVESKWMSVISLGLNNQTVHHLFPSVHICHYPALSGVLADFCKDYGIEYKVHKSISGAVKDYLQYLFTRNVREGSIHDLSL